MANKFVDTNGVKKIKAMVRQDIDAHHDASKQDTLVSGTNIKTVAGNSLLGSGNVALTKSDVGLGNVDNTSDANKPISTATQAALAAKQNALTVSALADGAVEKVIGFDAENGLKKEPWLVMTPLEVLNVMSGNVDPDVNFTTLSTSATLGFAPTGSYDKEITQADPSLYSQAAIEDGYAALKDIEGKSYRYVQLVQNGNFENINHWAAQRASLTVSNNIATVTAIEANNTFRITQTFIATENAKAGEKLLIIASVKSPTLTSIRFTGANLGSKDFAISTSFKTCAFLTSVVNDQNTVNLWITYAGNAQIGDAFDVKDVNIFDLTDMEIDTTDVDVAKAELARLGIDVYSANPYGTEIRDSKPVKLISRGVNQWNEQWEQKGYKFSDGTKEVQPCISSKELFIITPSESYRWTYPTNEGSYVFYFDKNKNYIKYEWVAKSASFTPPVNAMFMGFNMPTAYGTVYNNDICINISNPDIDGKYYPSVKHEYDLTLPVMRSAGSVRDNTKKVNVDQIDLSDYTFASYTTGGGQTLWRANVNQLDAAPQFPTSSSTLPDISCDKYAAQTWDHLYSLHSKGIGLNNGYIYICDDNIQSASDISGIVNYALATPTDQSGVSVPETIEVAEGGTLEAQYASGYSALSAFKIDYIHIEEVA